MAPYRAVSGRVITDCRGRKAGTRRALWMLMKKGRQGVGEQPRSDGGKGVVEDGSGRTEASTNVTMAAGAGDNWHRRTCVRIKKRLGSTCLLGPPPSGSGQCVGKLATSLYNLKKPLNWYERIECPTRVLFSGRERTEKIAFLWPPRHYLQSRAELLWPWKAFWPCLPWPYRSGQCTLSS